MFLVEISTVLSSVPTPDTFLSTIVVYSVSYSMLDALASRMPFASIANDRYTKQILMANPNVCCVHVTHLYQLELMALWSMSNLSPL